MSWYVRLSKSWYIFVLFWCRDKHIRRLHSYTISLEFLLKLEISMIFQTAGVERREIGRRKEEIIEKGWRDSRMSQYRFLINYMKINSTKTNKYPAKSSLILSHFPRLAYFSFNYNLWISSSSIITSHNLKTLGDNVVAGGTFVMSSFSVIFSCNIINKYGNNFTIFGALGERSVKFVCPYPHVHTHPHIPIAITHNNEQRTTPYFFNDNNFSAPLK